MNKLFSTFRKRKYLYAGIIIVLIVGGYYWYKKSHSASIQVQYVTTTVEKGTLITSISGSGNIIVDNSANIDPTITGTVANLSVSVGDKVEKGQFLFAIVNDDLSANVTKAYSSYLQSLGSLETAKANKKDAQENYDDGSSSEKSALKKKLEAAKISVTVAEENIKYALQNYRNERKDYADSKVTAPISGTVNAINIKNGDDLSKLSSGSSREIPMIIGDLNTLKAQVQVNEVDVSNVQIDQKTTLTFDALSEFTATGKVEKMDSLGTTTQGVVSYNVTISLDSLDSRIKPGMSVTAAIITNAKQNVITVPVSAVKNQNGNSYVEVLNGPAPTQVPVEVGASNNADTEIISGVNAGDKVVTQTINPSASSASTSSSRNSGARIPGLGGFGR